MKKVSRGFADQTTKREAVYAWVNFSETTNDYTIQKYVPKLREKWVYKSKSRSNSSAFKFYNVPSGTTIALSLSLNLFFLCFITKGSF